MLLEMLLLRVTELHTVFKKGSSQNCTAMSSDIRMTKVVSTESLKHLCSFSWPLFCCFYLLCLLLIQCTCAEKAIWWSDTTVMVSLQVFLTMSWYSLARVLLILVWTLLQEIPGSISFEFVAWKFTYKHSFCCCRLVPSCEITSLFSFFFLLHKKVTDLYRRWNFLK